MSPSSTAVAEVFPLLWSDDVGKIADWAVATLSLYESWRAEGESGSVEHAELHWANSKVSINIRTQQYANMGPSGISLRVDDRARVDALYAQAQAVDADILVPLADSTISYSFTARDPDGNQWWVNAENGFLDKIKTQAP